MAKIYETKDDLKRDVLRQQADRLHRASSNEAATGATFLMGGMLLDSIRAAKPATRGWLGVAGFVATVMGVIDLVKSWFTRSKAHTAELELEKLGPERMILPPEADCPTCPELEARRRAQPKSLLEHATQPRDAADSTLKR